MPSSRIQKALDKLCPVGTAVTQERFIEILEGIEIREIIDAGNLLIKNEKDLPVTLEGFCLACGEMSRFNIDNKFGGRVENGRVLPNWRERLDCLQCKMNNRQRLMAGLVRRHFLEKPNAKSYFMEQVTPIYRWVKREFDSSYLTGSEYLGHEYDSGQIVNGIRHENVEQLSFKKAELDLIVSNDVFEHVPNPIVAFRNCARVLTPGGSMLATFPFHHTRQVTRKRAELKQGVLENILPPEYHGNPISPEGSIVFTDFGWDVLDMFTQAGFRKAEVEIYASQEFGHIGHMPFVFRAIR
jgi:hypothetical protein